MLLRPEYLSKKLDQPLPTKDGGTLRTIRDACDYMTGMGKPSVTLAIYAHMFHTDDSKAAVAINAALG